MPAPCNRRKCSSSSASNQGRSATPQSNVIRQAWPRKIGRLSDHDPKSAWPAPGKALGNTYKGITKEAECAPRSSARAKRVDGRTSMKCRHDQRRPSLCCAKAGAMAPASCPAAGSPTGALAAPPRTPSDAQEIGTNLNPNGREDLSLHHYTSPPITRRRNRPMRSPRRAKSPRRPRQSGALIPVLPRPRRASLRECGSSRSASAPTPPTSNGLGLAAGTAWRLMDAGVPGSSSRKAGGGSACHGPE